MLVQDFDSFSPVMTRYPHRHSNEVQQMKLRSLSQVPSEGRSISHGPPADGCTNKDIKVMIYIRRIKDFGLILFTNNYLRPDCETTCKYASAKIRKLLKLKIKYDIDLFYFEQH